MLCNKLYDLPDTYKSVKFSYTTDMQNEFYARIYLTSTMNKVRNCSTELLRGFCIIIRYGYKPYSIMNAVSCALIFHGYIIFRKHVLLFLHLFVDAWHILISVFFQIANTYYNPLPCTSI